MHSKDLGDMAELAAAKRLKSLGHTVLFPFGDNERYDLVYDDAKGFNRSQVRKASERDGFIVFKCYSNHRKGGEIVRDTFEEKEIDCFLVWHASQDNIYSVPVEEAPDSEMRLRITETDNNQERGVNYAENYRL